MTREGSGSCQTNAYISYSTVGIDNKPPDVDMDIFNRGLCLPNNNKMSIKEQDKVIEIIQACFEWCEDVQRIFKEFL